MKGDGGSQLETEKEPFTELGKCRGKSELGQSGGKTGVRAEGPAGSDGWGWGFGVESRRNTGRGSSVLC